MKTKILLIIWWKLINYTIKIEIWEKFEKWTTTLSRVGST